MTPEAALFVRNSQVLERSLDGELVLYQPATDDVTLLDHIGGLIWSHLTTPISIASMSTLLANL